MAHEGEKAGDGKGFVAITYDFEVNGMTVVEVGEEGDGGVYRYHKQDTNNTVVLLLDIVSERGLPGRTLSAPTAWSNESHV